jgi:multiple antibiotic resistance protein
MLLFLQALTLTFSSPGLSSINEGERRDAEKPGDIAVFPLAFPLIASPGALSAVVLLTGRAQGWQEDASITVMIGLCLIITFIAMRAADVLVRILGQTGADVVGRISGILLAGLAVQFIFDGLRGGFPQAFAFA